MDAALKVRLYSNDHARCLSWFEEHAGETTPLPKPLAKDLYLVTQAKGIYKPKWMPYVLSIRMTAQNRYQDSQIERHEDGSWSFRYAQEDDKRFDPDNLFTNRAMRACIKDRIPIGVLRQERERAQYEILGLAVPVGLEAGFFTFQSYSLGNRLVVDTYEDPLDDEAEKVAWPVEEGPLPDDDYDARIRILSEISRRQGQPLFRARLLVAYNWHCAVTGCSVHGVLEAAHIRPYRGLKSNSVTNGILLRADIHTLLDKQLISFHPGKRTVAISNLLTGTCYDSLSGRPIYTPSEPNARLSGEALQRAWLEFQKAETIRIHGQ